MRTLYKNIKLVRKDLVILLLISIDAIVLIDFVLDDIPELFYGGYKIGLIISSLSLAYLAGFIFCFLTVHLKAENDKRKYNEVIGHLTFSIVSITDSMVSDLINYNKTDKKEYDKALIYNSGCAINEFKKDSPLHWVDGKQGDWIDYLYCFTLDIHSDIKKLNERIIFLEQLRSTLIFRIKAN